jgi:hypothetical protein
MQNEDEFYAEKSRLLAEKEEAEKRTEELQAQTQELKLDTQFREAYTGAGGSGDSEAYEMVKRFLGDRMQVENGQPVFLDRDGLVELGEYGPKSLAEKMAELKRIPTFKGFFSGGADQTDNNSQQPKTYTREDARSGKASINDIASGKASVENTSDRPEFVPAAKRVSITEIAKLKSRNWK